MKSSSVALLLLSLLPLASCSPKKDPPDNGVNDVKAACVIRTSWSNPTGDKCSLCKSAAPIANCGCEAEKDFGGACQSQGDARRAEPTCTPDLLDCRAHCNDDCNCIDNCYANAPKCKPLVAAEDGCVADVCAKFCNSPDGGP
jgi:hypothetical protein